MFIVFFPPEVVTAHHRKPKRVELARRREFTSAMENQQSAMSFLQDLFSGAFGIIYEELCGNVAEAND
jgi:hypothetical protein